MLLYGALRDVRERSEATRPNAVSANKIRYGNSTQMDLEEAHGALKSLKTLRSSIA
jgi:hypothetical protein